MLTTVFITSIMFADWDACWTYAHANDLIEEADEVCVTYELDEPRYTLRPKAREDLK